MFFIFYLSALALIKRIEKLEWHSRDMRIFKQDIMSHIRSLNHTMRIISDDNAELRGYYLVDKKNEKT
jgi:hypothetical protein